MVKFYFINSKPRGKHPSTNLGVANILPPVSNFSSASTNPPLHRLFLVMIVFHISIVIYQVILLNANEISGNRQTSHLRKF